MQRCGAHVFIKQIMLTRSTEQKPLVEKSAPGLPLHFDPAQRVSASQDGDVVHIRYCRGGSRRGCNGKHAQCVHAGRQRCSTPVRRRRLKQSLSFTSAASHPTSRDDDTAAKMDKFVGHPKRLPLVSKVFEAHRPHVPSIARKLQKSRLQNMCRGAGTGPAPELQAPNADRPPGPPAAHLSRTKAWGLSCHVVWGRSPTRAIVTPMEHRR